MYQDNPNNSPGDRGKYRTSPAPPERHSYPQNGGTFRSHAVPRLGVTLEHDDGRLGVDFGSNGGNNSDPGTDEGSSELPWTRNDNMGLSEVFVLFRFLNFS